MPDLSEFDAFAEFYDLEHGDYTEDIPLYVRYAERTGSPLLEIGCGTGRLLLPLAEAGFRIDGVDISGAMLARATQKARDAGVEDRVSLVQADARSLDLKTEYAMAFIGLNSLMHFTSKNDQLAVLRSIRRHLIPGGTFIVDLFNPDANLDRDDNGQLIHEWTRAHPDGRGTVVKLSSRRHDEDSDQMLLVTWFYQVIDSQGLARWTVLPYRIHYFYRPEIDLLLERAGFRVEGIYGSYDLDEYEADSPRIILVARASAAARRAFAMGD
jgi:ubiquinone/menaquinone biosynthesis C-methylase UbiE